MLQLAITRKVHGIATYEALNFFGLWRSLKKAKYKIVKDAQATKIP
jgi:hypothetical protein